MRARQYVYMQSYDTNIIIGICVRRGTESKISRIASRVGIRYYTICAVTFLQELNWDASYTLRAFHGVDLQLQSLVYINLR